MTKEQKEQLLSDVKDKLQITWNRDQTDKELLRMIDDATAKLNHMLGAEMNYSASGMQHELFLNYCMYARNNCVNEFTIAYREDIYMLRAINEVAKNENRKPE